MKLTLILSATLLSLCSCVSVHPGRMAKTTDPNNEVLVSVKVNHSLSDNYYLFLEYTVENQSPNWQKFEVKQLGFAGTESEILVNSRLSSWIESKELELKRQQYNTSVILGSVAAVGGIVAASSSNGNIQVSGLALAGGALTVAAANEFSNKRSNVAAGRNLNSQTVNVPKTYILAPFEVAPGSYLKRWVVVKKPRALNDYGRLPELITNTMQNKKEVSYSAIINGDGF